MLEIYTGECWSIGVMEYCRESKKNNMFLVLNFQYSITPSLH